MLYYKMKQARDASRMDGWDGWMDVNSGNQWELDLFWILTFFDQQNGHKIKNICYSAQPDKVATKAMCLYNLLLNVY